MIALNGRREFFWDDFIVDTEKTTASRRVHHPVRKEVAFCHDAPWEGDGCDFFSIVHDPLLGKYRMYYNGWEMLNPESTKHTTLDIHVCMIESEDGVHWTRPELGIHEFNGSTKNNIVACASMFPGMVSIDNFFVMIDDNPNRAVPERYKAVMMYYTGDGNGGYIKKLYALASDDGCNFRYLGVITGTGRFDTLNTALWDAQRGRYLCYIRDFHHPADADGVVRDVSYEDEKNINQYIRDIRVLSSPDFLRWSTPRRIDFEGAEDYPLYTNCVFPYPGSPHMLVGLPSRYVERRAWNSNFDRLCGAQKRRARMGIEPRLGLATTDCLFMCSRDGESWRRYDEAFMRPGPEQPMNWVYGDCFPAVGVIPSPADLPDADRVMSLYVFENHWMGVPANTARYVLRWDGFVSLCAGIAPRKIVTKPFTFTGSVFCVNFETSARGWLYIRLRNLRNGQVLASEELFGDRVNRVVDFDGDLSALAGCPVVLEMELCDADVYAFQFLESEPQGDGI